MENEKLITELDKKYSLGFSIDLSSETIPKGLNEAVIHTISQKKNEPAWLLEWRLKAYKHWLTLKPPTWANLKINDIDYQDLHYYSAPKSHLDSLEKKEIPKELMDYYEKLGVPLHEREILAGNIAIDAVIDSVSVGTTFKDKLEKVGVIFSSFSDAVHSHPELIKEYLGSVVNYKDNFFAALNSATFSDGSFCFIPKGIKCPMELSTYFRINQAKTGQFERTLIIAEEGSYVSYLEGCFLSGTPIYMHKNSSNQVIKNIENINAGDFILDHQGEKQKVLNRQEKNVINKKTYTFYISYNKFTCTEEHPIYIYRNNKLQFIEAKNITTNDKLCIPKKIFNEVQLNNNVEFNTTFDNYVLITILDITLDIFNGTVYNLEVENSHTYNVCGLAVHNCSSPERMESQLHAAVVEIIAMKNATVKYATVQNWYPGDNKGFGGIYNFVTKRGECRGDNSHISWTQIETGSGITWKYPSVILKGDNSSGEFYSVALTNHYQQADTGTKMIHLGKNTKSTIIAKSISAGNSVGNYRGLVRIAKKAINAKNFTQCDSLIFGNARVDTYPHIENYQYKSNLEHEATTTKISEENLFYLKQHGMNEEQSKNMLVNGFCKSVFQKLPAEFAVEAQKLLEINLEGSMG